MRVGAIGIAFYERDDYPRVLEIMADGHVLPGTYDEFLQRFEQAERQASGKHAIVVRAVIEPEQFQAWCRRHGLKVDAQARMRFANEAAIAEVRKRQGGF